MKYPKMKNYLAALTATALLSVAPFALAASSTELTVTGFITPSACMPSFSGDGKVDLGKIPVKDLNPNPNQFTRLPKQPIQFTVTCDAATFFALDGLDNQDGTALWEDTYGLGRTDAGETLGGFYVNALTVLADGQPTNVILKKYGEEDWFFNNKIYKGYLTAVSAPGIALPIAATNVAMDLEIEPFIAATNNLTLTDEVLIDGSVTIEVKYL
jgi:type 1 fimbria pilin